MSCEGGVPGSEKTGVGVERATPTPTVADVWMAQPVIRLQPLSCEACCIGAPVTEASFVVAGIPQCSLVCCACFMAHAIPAGSGKTCAEIASTAINLNATLRITAVSYPGAMTNCRSEPEASFRIDNHDQPSDLDAACGCS